MIFIMENENIAKPRKYFEGRGYHRDYFCNIDTEEKAYILGFLWGDGSYIPSKRTIALAVSVKDEDHLIRMASCIGLSSDQVRKHESHVFGGQTFEYVKIQMAHKLFFESLERLGFGKKVERMRCPPTVPKSLQRHFFRGLFDADGSVYISKVAGSNRNKGRMDVSLRHMEAVNWWRQYFCEYLGVEFSIGRDKSIYRVCIGSKKNLVLVFNHLYGGSSIYLGRKYQKFVKAIGPNNFPETSVLPLAA